jgi:S-(hydroxymethyl)glutathione dehydrogenase/alcohol dehydrogenase
VVGCGGVGLAAIQGARIAGAATILAVDPLPAKHGLALALGATHAVTPDDAEQARKELAGGSGFDYAFEVVGVAATIRSAWRLARRGGTVIVVGAGTRADTVPFSVFELLYDGKELLSSGLLNIEGLITSRIAFGQLNDAISALRRGDAIRQVVTFG